MWKITHTWHKKSNAVNPPIIASLRKSSFFGASAMTFFGLCCSYTWFGLVLRIWNVWLLCYSCEKFSEFWNVSLFRIYVLGQNALVRLMCCDRFSTCTTKQFDTPRAYTDWKFVLAQICIVMGFGKNYLYWWRDFLFWSMFYLHHQTIWYTQSLYGLEICFGLKL